MGARSGLRFKRGRRHRLAFVHMSGCEGADPSLLKRKAGLSAKEKLRNYVKPADGWRAGPHFEDLSFRNSCGWLFSTLTTTSICTCSDRDGASSQAFNAVPAGDQLPLRTWTRTSKAKRRPELAIRQPSGHRAAARRGNKKEGTMAVRRESGWFHKKSQIIKQTTLPLYSQFERRRMSPVGLLGHHLNRY